MTPKSAMIFAAGFGTRMRPLTLHTPKPMVEVGGQPMINYAIQHARDAGAEIIVSNLHYLHNVIEPHLVDLGVQTVHEHPDVLDTGGGLRNALPILGTGSVWTLNPDAIWQGPNPLKFAANHWDSDKMDALLVCVAPAHARGTSSAGDFEIGPSGRISRGAGAIYAGAQIVKTDSLAVIPDSAFSLNVLWDQLIANGRCYACLYPGKWCDVGHPEGIPLAESLLIEAMND